MCILFRSCGYLHTVIFVYFIAVSSVVAVISDLLLLDLKNTAMIVGVLEMKMSCSVTTKMRLFLTWLFKY